MQGEGILLPLLVLLVSAQQARGGNGCCMLSSGIYAPFDDRPANYFQGNCTYNFVSDNARTFSVWVDAERYNNRYFIPERVWVHYGGVEYIMTESALLVDNQPEYPTDQFQAYANGDIRIKKSGNILEFDIVAKSVRMKLEGGQGLEICLDDQWKQNPGLVHGLCGNYNGRPEDDVMTSDGSQALNEEVFRRSWRVGNEEGCETTTGGEPLPVSTTITQAQTTTTSSSRAPQTTTAPSQQWGRCSVRLDPHGETPDGQIFQVNDVCTYDLAVATNGDFSVGMQTYRRNIVDERRGISFVKKIMISHNGDNYEMFPNALSVNGNVVTLPDSDMNVNCSFGEYKLCCDSKTSPFKFCSDRKFSFYLYFGNAYQNGLNGLCGNFNGSSTDDYILRNGTDVGNQSKGMEVFVDDWKSSDC